MFGKEEAANSSLAKILSTISLQKRQQTGPFPTGWLAGLPDDFNGQSEVSFMHIVISFSRM